MNYYGVGVKFGGTQEIADRSISKMTAGLWDSEEKKSPAFMKRRKKFSQAM